MNPLRWILPFVLIFASAFAASAQAVYAQVSSKQVQVGVPFEYAIVINATPSSYSPPNFRGFDVVSGPNQSSSTQWVNGQTSTQMTISWGLVAKSEGRHVIGPAAVMIASQRHETSSIAVEVLRGAAGSQQSGGQAQASSPIGSADLFIRTNVSKMRCYVGEQVTIVQKVYSRLQIIGFQKFSQPTYNGFYSQAQESTSKGQLAVENLDGVNFYTYELFRTVAIANQPGKVVLTPIEGDVVVRRQSNSRPRNIFEQFFGASGYEDVPVPVKSRPVTVEVTPLPEQGKPVDFSGAVGVFTRRIDLSRNTVKANDALNLKITISGHGNLKLLPPPPLKLPDGFETYDPKVSEGNGTKSFDYLVIPRREGDYTLSGLDFSYFNLDSRRYVTIPAGDVHVKVLPPDPNASGAQVFSPHNQVRESENDIRYIKKGDFILSREQPEFFNSAAHIGLLALPVVLLGGGLFLRRNRIRNNSNLVLVRERAAARTAKKHLARAEKLMKEGRKDEFYAALLSALNDYLGHKLHIAVSELSRDRVNIALAERGATAAKIGELNETLQTCEFARYAPGSVSGDLNSVYGAAVALVTSIDQQLNLKRA